jgi:hypothetical protein
LRQSKIKSLSRNLLRRKLEGLDTITTKKIGKVKADGGIKVERVERVEQKIYASDSLLQFLLKNVEPETYSEKTEIEVTAPTMPIIQIMMPTDPSENSTENSTEETTENAN